MDQKPQQTPSDEKSRRQRESTARRTGSGSDGRVNKKVIAAVNDAPHRETSKSSKKERARNVGNKTVGATSGQMADDAILDATFEPLADDESAKEGVSPIDRLLDLAIGPRRDDAPSEPADEPPPKREPSDRTDRPSRQVRASKPERSNEEPIASFEPFESDDAAKRGGFLSRLFGDDAPQEQTHEEQPSTKTADKPQKRPSAADAAKDVKAEHKPPKRSERKTVLHTDNRPADDRPARQTIEPAPLATFKELPEPADDKESTPASPLARLLDLAIGPRREDEPHADAKAEAKPASTAKEKVAPTTEKVALAKPASTAKEKVAPAKPTTVPVVRKKDDAKKPAPRPAEKAHVTRTPTAKPISKEPVALSKPAESPARRTPVVEQPASMRRTAAPGATKPSPEPIPASTPQTLSKELGDTGDLRARHKQETAAKARDAAAKRQASQSAPSSDATPIATFEQDTQTPTPKLGGLFAHLFERNKEEKAKPVESSKASAPRPKADEPAPVANASVPPTKKAPVPRQAGNAEPPVATPKDVPAPTPKPAKSAQTPPSAPKQTLTPSHSAAYEIIRANERRASDAAAAKRQSESAPAAARRQPEPVPVATFETIDEPKPAAKRQPEPVPVATFETIDEPKPAAKRQAEHAPVATNRQPEPSPIAAKRQSEPAPVATFETIDEPKPNKIAGLFSRLFGPKDEQTEVLDKSVSEATPASKVSTAAKPTVAAKPVAAPETKPMQQAPTTPQTPAATKPVATAKPVSAPKSEPAPRRVAAPESVAVAKPVAAPESKPAQQAPTTPEAPAAVKPVVAPKPVAAPKPKHTQQAPATPQVPAAAKTAQPVPANKTPEDKVPVLPNAVPIASFEPLDGPSTTRRASLLSRIVDLVTEEVPESDGAQTPTAEGLSKEQHKQQDRDLNAFLTRTWDHPEDAPGHVDRPASKAQPVTKARAEQRPAAQAPQPQAVPAQQAQQAAQQKTWQASDQRRPNVPSPAAAHRPWYVRMRDSNVPLIIALVVILGLGVGGTLRVRSWVEQQIDEADKAAAAQVQKAEARTEEAEQARIQAERELREKEIAVEAEKARKEPVEINLMAIGDVILHYQVREAGLNLDGSRNYDHAFAHIAGELEHQDIKIVNQETTLGGEFFTYSGEPNFNGPQEVGDAEAKVGFNVVAKASEHALDIGYNGLISEFSYWDGFHPEVHLIGASNPNYGMPANDVYVFEKNEFKVAVVNYTFDFGGYDPSGCVSRLEYNHVLQTMADANAKADMIVVIPHWGEEESNRPTDAQYYWAKVLIDAGADVIIGCHPHLIQPVELFESPEGNVVPCMWSLGSFVSTFPNDENLIGGMAKVSLQKDANGKCTVTSARFIPVVTHLGESTNMTTYLLRDWNDDLAASNWLQTAHNSSSNTTLTVERANEICTETLGEAFDKASEQLNVDLNGYRRRL